MPLVNNSVTPVSTGFTAFGTGGVSNLLNNTSGTNSAPVNGTIYWAAIMVPYNCRLTGIMVSIGNVGGTDSLIVGLYDANGALLANSALAGTVAGTANTKQKVAFTAAVDVVGPGTYYIALQANGTTMRFLTFSSATEAFVTGSTTGTFGTLPSITPGTTYTTNVGPFATTY